MKSDSINQMYGTALGYVRQYCCLTLKQMAIAIDCSKAVIQCAQSGRGATLATIDKYAKFMEVPTSDLVRFAEIVNGDTHDYSEVHPRIKIMIAWLKDIGVIKSQE